MTYKIAIIGSGPSAFYAAQALFKSDLDIKVDMFEKLATPYGLLRGGVAPDHQQMKTISKSYDKIATNENFRFFGNVDIGSSISIDELKQYYNSIILAIGAETDKKMNIKGETTSGSHTATEFVGWYNGHPDFQNQSFDLKGTTAVIIGQGNVAVDVTRILAKPIDELKKTDITNNAIIHLADSQITDIYMIGRRGPAQAAFTELELKELGQLSDVNIKIHDDINLSDEDQTEIETTSKARKNITQLKELKANETTHKRKTIHIMFYLSPTEIIEENNKIKELTLEKNKLSGNAGEQKALSTGEKITLKCDILFRSIGYRGVPLENVPFDDKRGIIPNINGQVINEEKDIVNQLYVTGWIKRGPSGVIGTNRNDSIETVQTCLENLEHTKIINNGDFKNILKEKNIKFITYDDWKIIDEYEQKEGLKVGKPREKITSIETALNILKK